MIVLPSCEGSLNSVADGVVQGLTSLNGQWCAGIGRLLVRRCTLPCAACCVMRRGLAWVWVCLLLPFARWLRSCGLTRSACMSTMPTTRLQVHRPLFDELLKIVLDKFAEIKLGSSMESTTSMGPQSHRTQQETMTDTIARLTALGGVAHSSTRMPTTSGGCFLPPTIITGAPGLATLVCVASSSSPDAVRVCVPARPARVRDGRLPWRVLRACVHHVPVRHCRRSGGTRQPRPRHAADLRVRPRHCRSDTPRPPALRRPGA